MNVNTLLYSTEAEQSVLGALMLNNEAWILIAERLVEFDFYHLAHQLLYRAIKSLSEEMHPCDPVTLSEWLQRANLFEKVGNGNYLARLLGSTPSAANVIAYANIVREKSVFRQISKIGLEMSEKAHDPGEMSSQEVLSLFEQKTLGIAEQREQKHFLAFDSLLSSSFKKILELSNNPNKLLGLETGFNNLDKITSGLQKSDLIIVAGRPSMGKTAFAINIGQHVAFNLQIPVAVFSLEMSAEQLMMRLYATGAKINLNHVRSGTFNDDESARFTSCLSAWEEQQPPLFIDESTLSLDVHILRARARRLKREQPNLGLIIIDYIQLMRGNGNTRNDEIGNVSQTLKALAKELNVPVIAISQLNRNVESRLDKRPQMSDLRDSGSLEQDADLIIFIYRDEVYNFDTAEKGVAEIIIAKQRNGPIDTVKLLFEKQHTLFKNGDFYYDDLE